MLHNSGNNNNIGLNQKQVVLKSCAPKKIAKIQFGTMDYKEMALCSELQVLVQFVVIVNNNDNK